MKIAKIDFIEKLIEEFWEERTSKKQLRINSFNEQLILEQFINFLKIDDLYRNLNNSKIAKLLYSTKPKISLTEVCRKMFIDEKTLYRYRKKYIRLFNIIVNLDTEKNISGKNCPIQK